MKLIKMFDMTDMNNKCAVYEREFGSKLYEGTIGDCPMYIWKNQVTSFNVENNKMVFFIEYK